jgi:hypothetical protein
MGTNMEFMLLLALFVIIAQAVHNTWLAWVLKETKLDLQELEVALMAVANGEAKLEIREDD